MLRLLLWRIVGVLAVLSGFAIALWLLGGGPGRILRGEPGAGVAGPALGSIPTALGRAPRALWQWAPGDAIAPARALLVLLLGSSTLVFGTRGCRRRRRRYVRLRVEPYRSDQAGPEALVSMFEALHGRLVLRWWRRLPAGQPSLALEAHHSGRGEADFAWLAVTCPEGLEPMAETALRSAYPNCRLGPPERSLGVPPVVLRLKKRGLFIERSKVIERLERDADPPMNRVLTVLGACGEQAFVQVALTPAPAFFEDLAKRLFKRHETRLSRERREHLFVRDRSMVEDAELRGGLDVQHRPLFFADIRVVAPSRRVCERIASELRVDGAENRLVERGTAVRHGLLGLYTRRVQRGEGNPLPSFRKGVFAATELAALWQFPSVDYTTVPLARGAVPLAPAPPGVKRPRDGLGTLRDSRGPVSIEVGDAQAEHRRSRNGRAGQVELSGGERRRGSRPGAVRGDRDRSEGRRGRGGGERRPGVAPARCSTSPTPRAASTRSPSMPPPT